jgi:hypothetical protein
VSKPDLKIPIPKSGDSPFGARASVIIADDPLVDGKAVGELAEGDVVVKTARGLTSVVTHHGPGSPAIQKLREVLGEEFAPLIPVDNRVTDAVVIQIVDYLVRTIGTTRDRAAIAMQEADPLALRCKVKTLEQELLEARAIIEKLKRGTEKP